MLRKLPVEAIIALLVALFVYTALDKILDPRAFTGQMYNQPLPRPLATLLVWAVPSVELSAVVLLSIRRFRDYGLWLSSGLLLVFTIYVGMVYFNSFDRVPCSCAGAFKNMSWGSHLVFNAALTLVAFTGVYLERKQSHHVKRNCRGSLPDQQAQE